MTQLQEGAGNVTVSGETVTDNVAINRDARAVVVFRSTGGVDKIENVTTTGIDVADDWVRPASSAGANYEIRYVLDSGDALDPSTSYNDGQWGDMRFDVFFEQRATDSPAQNFESTITISIRFNGGDVLDSATYVIEAQADTV